MKLPSKKDEWWGPTHNATFGAVLNYVHNFSTKFTMIERNKVFELCKKKLFENPLIDFIVSFFLQKICSSFSSQLDKCLNFII